MSKYSLNEEEFLDAFNKMVKERNLTMSPAFNTLWKDVKDRPYEMQIEKMEEVFTRHEAYIQEYNMPYTQAGEEVRGEADRFGKDVTNDFKDITHDIEPYIISDDDLDDSSLDYLLDEVTVAPQTMEPQQLEDFSVQVLGKEVVDEEITKEQTQEKESISDEDQIEDKDLRSAILAEASDVYKAYVSYMKKPDKEHLQLLNRKIHQYNEKSKEHKEGFKPKHIPEYTGEFKQRELKGQKMKREFIQAIKQTMKPDEKAVINLAILNRHLYAEDVVKLLEKKQQHPKMNAVEMLKEIKNMEREAIMRFTLEKEKRQYRQNVENLRGGKAI